MKLLLRFWVPRRVRRLSVKTYGGPYLGHHRSSFDILERRQRAYCSSLYRSRRQPLALVFVTPAFTLSPMTFFAKLTRGRQADPLPASTLVPGDSLWNQLVFPRACKIASDCTRRCDVAGEVRPMRTSHMPGAAGRRGGWP
ncbi:hypothetical protein BU26DRAFT_154581 [Trematosphaeria pertusa]|uniref:Uncharacterized protein n=1 Tax=Trematosphaeria pertusa TaxID=390896 RepID=A0A6A6IZM7_9PLEO|nr:uncharacterized protein BU26DRAFT_154581 [Trematosphaeria pertusa]KAF2255362.1 hypothetical protein BU26DRAFT_154581 [Trematosphaeria pertusa]